MNNTTFFNYKGSRFIREVDPIGDISRILWFTQDQKEIYDNELMVELEDAYTSAVIETFTPTTPII